MIPKRLLDSGKGAIRFLAVILVLPLLVQADIVEQSETIMTLKNMGAGINGPGDEFYPSITADGKTMVFSIRPKNKDNSDIFISDYVNGAWTTPLSLDVLNTEADEQTPFISPDGQLILFSSNREGAVRTPRTGGPEYFLTNDLYISYRVRGRWSPPDRLEGDVNTDQNERAPSLSKDGSTLYFSRYPGNSLEKSVIYQATLGDRGFGNVRPLPAPVNSSYSDFALMPSNNKPGFYFSSNRPGGKGLWDIYYVHYIDKKFGEPINLGAPINSEHNDLTVTEIGNVIYFCSDRSGGLGGSDIYTIYLTPKIFNVPDTGFKFFVKERASGKAVTASFSVRVEGEKKEGVAPVENFLKKSDARGQFEVKVELGTSKIVVSSNDGRYRPYRGEFVPEPGEMRDVQIKFNIAEVKAPEPTIETFRPVYFNTGFARIRMKEMPYIREIAQKLRADPDLCLRLTGHADSRGNKASNKRLSLRRAREVKSALMHFGIGRYRFQLKGKGDEEPSDLYFTTGRHIYNRRVEFHIIDREEVDDDEDLP